jgi:hypothetical protein
VTSYNNTGLAPSSTYYYRVRATNAVGDSQNATASATTLTPALPAPWVDADIGTTGAAGSGVLSNGTFTIQGAGADIWNSADSFNFVYQPWTGSGQIIARVTSVQNTNSGAHAGVMIRETLAANSKAACVVIQSGGGMGFVRRTSTGGSSTVTTASVNIPYYLKLIRNGSTFTAWRSSTGTSWTQVGSSVSISMASTVYIGLAVCSKVPGTLCTATLSNVTTSTSTSSTLAPSGAVSAPLVVVNVPLSSTTVANSKQDQESLLSVVG